MKKQFLILAGSALILASCGGNDASKENDQKRQMDSIANANAAMQEQINKAKNDSTINALAKAKADSIEAATKAAEKTPTHKGGGKTKPPAATPAPTAPAPVKTAQDNKFDSRTPGGNKEKPQMTQDQQKAQDDKFNRRK